MKTREVFAWLSIALAIPLLSGCSQATAPGPQADAARSGASWQALNNAAQEADQKKNYPEQEQQLLKALKIAESFGDSDMRFETSLSNLAMYYKVQGLPAQAEPYYKMILTIDERERGQEHLDVATDLSALAEVCAEQGRYTQAEPLYKRASDIYQRALDRQLQEMADTLHSYSQVLHKINKTDDAAALERRATTLRSQRQSSQKS